MIDGIEVVRIVTGVLKENCYIVADEASGDMAVVDPGDNADAILAALGERKGTLRAILLTHGHHDHVGAVSVVCDAYKLEAQVHAGDTRLIRQAPLYALSFTGRQMEVPRPVKAFAEQPEAGLGALRFGAIHTPGHTPGSVVYTIGRAAFTGDTLTFEHVGRTDFPGASRPQIEESVSRFLSAAQPDTVLFPGHGRRWTAGEAAEWWNSSGVAAAASESPA
ncbi:MAG TPA: MBL fold metallo-hydrolase [Gemmatimonadaceae bacterium]